MKSLKPFFPTSLPVQKPKPVAPVRRGANMSKQAMQSSTPTQDCVELDSHFTGLIDEHGLAMVAGFGSLLSGEM